MQSQPNDPMMKVLFRIFIVIIIFLAIAIYGRVTGNDVSMLLAAVSIFYFPLIYQWRKAKIEQIDSGQSDEDKGKINIFVGIVTVFLIFYQLAMFSETLR